MNQQKIFLPTVSARIDSFIYDGLMVDCGAESLIVSDQSCQTTILRSQIIRAISEFSDSTLTIRITYKEQPDVNLSHPNNMIKVCELFAVQEKPSSTPMDTEKNSNFSIIKKALCHVGIEFNDDLSCSRSLPGLTSAKKRTGKFSPVNHVSGFLSSLRKSSPKECSTENPTPLITPNIEEEGVVREEKEPIRKFDEFCFPRSQTKPTVTSIIELKSPETVSQLVSKNQQGSFSNIQDLNSNRRRSSLRLLLADSKSVNESDFDCNHFISRISERFNIKPRDGSYDHPLIRQQDHKEILALKITFKDEAAALNIKKNPQSEYFKKELNYKPFCVYTSEKKMSDHSDELKGPRQFNSFNREKSPDFEETSVPKQVPLSDKLVAKFEKDFYQSARELIEDRYSEKTIKLLYNRFLQAVDGLVEENMTIEVRGFGVIHSLIRLSRAFFELHVDFNLLLAFALRFTSVLNLALYDLLEFSKQLFTYRNPRPKINKHMCFLMRLFSNEIDQFESVYLHLLEEVLDLSNHVPDKTRSWVVSRDTQLQFFKAFFKAVDWRPKNEDLPDFGEFLANPQETLKRLRNERFDDLKFIRKELMTQYNGLRSSMP